jgi:2'-5' RNA ligase
MRLFIGIGLPVKVGERLLREASRLFPAGAGDSVRIRWARPGDLHLTLAFLGQVDPARVQGIQRSLAMIDAARLHLELRGVAAFPGILHVRVQPSAPLLALAERVTSSMESCGFPREQRPFVPHVTLARTKGRILGRNFANAAGKGDPAFRQAFAANEFLLYQSLTGPAGSHYEALGAFPLR